jgi:hypothetical protein
VAAGDAPGIVATYLREGRNLATTLIAVPQRVYAPLVLDDSITLVPIESLAVMPPQRLREARARAVDLARAWSARWLAVGPTEGEAFRAAAKVAELAGDLDLALAHLDRAEALGTEYLAGGSGFWRIGMLARLGRFDHAARIADSLWVAGRFARFLAMPNDQFIGISWAFNLFLLRGDAGRADTLVETIATRFVEAGLVAGPLAHGIAVRLLSGMGMRPFFGAAVPLGVRLSVMDTLYARRASLPAGGRIAGLLPFLARETLAEAATDSAHGARAAAAPWPEWARP